MFLQRCPGALPEGGPRIITNHSTTNRALGDSQRHPDGEPIGKQYSNEPKMTTHGVHESYSSSYRIGNMDQSCTKGTPDSPSREGHDNSRAKNMIDYMNTVNFHR